jgi:pimeloyl-ACP methyl ester carboxylesterase
MTEHTVSVPGATLVYDVHGELADGVTPLLLVASPMDASGFGTLASHFRDRVVVTLDPRNAGRSKPDDPGAPVTAQEHAEDLHAVITDLGAGPVDLFGSSGGAANALMLVAAHPDDLRLLVAHEPPMAGTLPDHEHVRAVTDDMLATYDEQGEGPAMAKFISFVMHRGLVTPAYLEQPDPDPAVFGMPSDDDGSRDSPLMANMRGGGVDAVPDAAAIRAASTRVVVAVGEESATSTTDGEMAGRAAYGVAGLLGLEPVVFPGGHGGFLGGEHGQVGKPDEFAAKLREVLATAGG